MSISVERCFRRAHLAEELVESWQIEHRQAMFALDVEEMVHECRDLGKLMQHTWILIHGGLFDGKIDNIDASGKMMEAAIKRTVRLFSKVLDLVQQGKRRGVDIDAEGFENLREKLSQLQLEVATKWPKVDLATVEASMADYRGGDFQTAEDLLNESQGDCAEDS